MQVSLNIPNKINFNSDRQTIPSNNQNPTCPTMNMNIRKDNNSNHQLHQTKENNDKESEADKPIEEDRSEDEYLTPSTSDASEGDTAD